jgi:hypothetical protein
MKTIKSILAVIAAALLTPFAAAQEVVVREGTVATQSGVVSSFDPNALVIASETNSEPIRYRFTKTTRYFDEEGNAVRVDTIQRGTPVVVEYARRGDALEASRVTVRSTSRAAVATTVEPLAPVAEAPFVGAPDLAPVVRPAPVRRVERIAVVEPIETAGTLAEVGDGTLEVRTTTGAPSHYRYSKTTRWVDDDGNVVTREAIRTGLPVSVYYTKAADDLMVSKVVVHRRPAAAVIEERSTPPVIEKKSTTTTTTITKEEDDDDD